MPVVAETMGLLLVGLAGAGLWGAPQSTRVDAGVEPLETEEFIAVPAPASIGLPLGETEHVLLERFGDFGEVDGCMLPYSYRIEYSIEGGFLGHWIFDAAGMTHNQRLDPRNFVAPAVAGGSR